MRAKKSGFYTKGLLYFWRVWVVDFLQVVCNTIVSLRK